MVDQLLTVGEIIFVFVTTLFVVSVLIKRNDIADVAWGIGIFLVAFVSYLSSDDKNWLLTTLVVLALLWGFRLGIRIFLRNIKKREDYRYKKWREEWGKWFYLRSYFQVYLLQGSLMIVIGYPFIHASLYSSKFEFGIFYVIGLLVWCVGYFFEVVGDYQLDKFIKNTKNKGKIMNEGLWKYSRHPNYFGEVIMWWGIFVLLLSLPYGVFAIISPLMITFLILKVSGVPMLEEKFAGNPEFEKYKKQTSVFFPLPRNIINE